MMGYFFLSLFYLIPFCLFNTRGTNDNNVFFLKQHFYAKLLLNFFWNVIVSVQTYQE